MNPRQALSIIRKKNPETVIELHQIVTNLESGEISLMLEPCKKNIDKNGYCIDAYDNEGNFIGHECKKGEIG